MQLSDRWKLDQLSSVMFNELVNVQPLYAKYSIIPLCVKIPKNNDFTDWPYTNFHWNIVIADQQYSGNHTHSLVEQIVTAIPCSTLPLFLGLLLASELSVHVSSGMVCHCSFGTHLTPRFGDDVTSDLASLPPSKVVVQGHAKWMRRAEKQRWQALVSWYLFVSGIIFGLSVKIWHCTVVAFCLYMV